MTNLDNLIGLTQISKQRKKKKTMKDGKFKKKTHHAQISKQRKGN